MSGGPGTILITDLETTNNVVEKAGACQLAAIAINPTSREITPIIQTYCRPSETMTDEAYAIHGIGPEQYAGAPTDVIAVWLLSALIHALPQPVILSGYNCTRYDYPIMQRLYMPGGFMRRPHIDVMTLMMREQCGQGMKLTEVFTRMLERNPKFREKASDWLEKAHDALADCWMTAVLLLGWMDRNQQADPMAVSHWCNTPQVLPSLPYGKHKGKPLKDVPASYLMWAAGNWTDMHPDVAATLRHAGIQT